MKRKWEEKDDANKKARDEPEEENKLRLDKYKDPDDEINLTNDSFVQVFTDEGKGIESDLAFDDSIESLNKRAHSTAIGDDISLEITGEEEDPRTKRIKKLEDELMMERAKNTVISNQLNRKEAMLVDNE